MDFLVQKLFKDRLGHLAIVETERSSIFGLRNTTVRRIIDPLIALIERQPETREKVNEGSPMLQRRSIVLANSDTSVIN